MDLERRVAILEEQVRDLVAAREQSLDREITRAIRELYSREASPPVLARSGT